jgi:hypothetical protein
LPTNYCIIQCNHCGENIQKTRPWTKFCSSSCRAAFHRTYHPIGKVKNDSTPVLEAKIEGCALQSELGDTEQSDQVSIDPNRSFPSSSLPGFNLLPKTVDSSAGLAAPTVALSNCEAATIDIEGKLTNCRQRNEVASVNEDTPPQAGEWLAQIDHQVRAQLERIWPDAKCFGWSYERIWNPSFWPHGPAEPRGLASILQPGDVVSEVSETRITILAQRRHIQRFRK